MLITTTTESRIEDFPFTESVYRMLTKGIVGYTGHEMRQWDYLAAVTHTTRILRMGLDDRDERALAMRVNALALNAPRFNGDAHLPSRSGNGDRSGVGENSGSHVLHAAVHGTSNVLRAGLFNPGQYDHEVARIALGIQRGALAHEDGEMAGEPASVAQSIHNVDGKEDKNYEPKMARFALELSYHLEESMCAEFQSARRQFLTITSAITESLDLQNRGLPSETEFDRIVGPHWQFNPSQDTRSRVDAWFKDYLRTEDPENPVHSRQERFIGYVTKIAGDRQQGNLYFIRACAKHPDLRRFRVDGEMVSALDSMEDQGAIPQIFSENARQLANFDYMFSKLGGMMSNAETPKEWQLARSVRNNVLQTGIDFLHVSNFVMELGSRQRDGHIEGMLSAMSRGELDVSARKELLRCLREKQKVLLQRHVEERTTRRLEGSSEKLGTDLVCNVETRLRLQAWLRFMIEKDYIFAPGESPINNLKEIARKLGPLPSRLLYQDTPLLIPRVAHREFE